MINYFSFKYWVIARFFPAILSILPIMVLAHYYLSKKIPEIIVSIFDKNIIGGISIFTILIFFVIQVSRYISKRYIQDNYFKNELYFPTTSHLLHRNDFYSDKFKEKIRKKIFEDFQIQLLNRREETLDETKARKKIKEAVDLMRNKVKNGRLLLQHNMEYGFFRNLLGGMVFSLPASILNVVIFTILYDLKAYILSACLLLLYLIIFLSRKTILEYLAINYAKILFNEYLVK